MPVETSTPSTAEIESPINLAVDKAFKALESLPNNDNNLDTPAKLAFKNAINDLVKSAETTDNINKTNEKNTTLLHFAIKKSSLFAVKCLLARGADITLQNEAGDTALHLAVKLGHLEIVEEMLGVSAAAKYRKTKSPSEDRNKKLSNLKKSQQSSESLLNEPNAQNEIPLIIAAKLSDDRIYKRLLKFAPHYYTKKVLDEALAIRKKKITGLKRISGSWAFLAALCPSGSALGIAGFVTGFGGAIFLSVAVSASIGLLMLPIIGFAYYQKNKFEKNAIVKLEELQVELAFLQGIEKKLNQPSRPDEIERIKSEYKAEYEKDAIKPSPLQSNANPTAYMSGQDKAVARMSLLAESLCAFSGALASIGAIATLVIYFFPAALLIVGIIGGVIGLTAGAGILYLQYKNRQSTYNTFRESKQSSVELQHAIYRERQKISSLFNSLPPSPQEDSVTENRLPEPTMSHSQRATAETNSIGQPKMQKTLSIENLVKNSSIISSPPFSEPTSNSAEPGPELSLFRAQVIKQF